MTKVWFITGRSRGLGRSLTEEVLSKGDIVVATARNSEQLCDFSEPHKIDLEAFLNKNYHFNVGIDVLHTLQGEALPRLNAILKKQTIPLHIVGCCQNGCMKPFS